MMINSYSEKIPECEKCQVKFAKAYQLVIDEGINSVKAKMEGIGFRTIIFKDLNSVNYLDNIHHIKDICLKKNAQVVIYVAGHGFNNGFDDFLIPNDIFDYYHSSNHDERLYSNYSTTCGLQCLLRAFEFDEFNYQLNLGVWWDLCRVVS